MDYDKSIHHNPDAQVWAKLFIETTRDMGREAFNDEGYMIGWFANAMMAMHDHLYTKEIERLREALQWFCERVERGEVQSRKSYARFKEELARAALKGDE